MLEKKEKSFLHTEAVPSLSETNNALSICTVPVAIDQPHFLFPRQFFFLCKYQPSLQVFWTKHLVRHESVSFLSFVLAAVSWPA